MTDTIVGIINIPDKEEGVRSLPPKLIVKKYYSDYFRDFDKGKILSAILKVKGGGISFKKDKDFLTKVINESRET